MGGVPCGRPADRCPLQRRLSSAAPGARRHRPSPGCLRRGRLRHAGLGWIGLASRRAPSVPRVKRRRFFGSGFGRGAQSCLVKSLYVTPFSAPFGGFCPRLRSLCKGWVRRLLPSVSGVGFSPVLACRTGIAFEPGPDGKGFGLSRQSITPADDADAPSGPSPLVCRTGTPGAPFGDETTEPVRRSAVPPCRRRETTFRRPFWYRITSVPHPKRRPRLAATPCGVSAAG